MCDAVILCSTMLYGVWIFYDMLICILSTCGGLLGLTSHVGMFWPRGSGLRVVRRNVFSCGRLARNDVKCVSLVN